MRNLFLHEHANGTKHGKTAVLKLLRLHVGKVGSIGGLETKGIKTNIARVVLVDEDSTECTIGVFVCRLQGLDKAKKETMSETAIGVHEHEEAMIKLTSAAFQPVRARNSSAPPIATVRATKNAGATSCTCAK
jgi:hypothetical protein